MNNNELRRAAKHAGVFLWQIAEALQISEATLLRRLRYSLTEQQRADLLDVVQRLAQEVDR